MSPVTINPNDSIQAAIDNASAGDTMELNGGVYNQCDINVTKVNLTIKASGNGGVPIIDGQGQGRGFNISSSGVLIQGLKITNTRITGSGGSTYIGYGGSGVYISGNGSGVSGCGFTNTIVTNGSGGGIFMAGVNCSVSGCSFINNTGPNSWGVVSISGSGCSVSGCSITNFDGTDGTGDGISINSAGVNCSVSGCNFTNITELNSGGGISIDSAGVNVGGCNFINTETTIGYAGGEVFTTSNSINANLSGCNFINCKGRRSNFGGGAYMIGDNSSVIGCNFTNNTVNPFGSGGGGLAIQNNGYIVSGCNFINNTATATDYNGGGVHITSFNGIVSGCNFINNTATATDYNGGGVHITSFNGIVSGCNFINNTANNGGGIYLMGGSNNVSGCSFINNKGSNGGGFMDQANNLNIVFNRFVNNTNNNGTMVNNGVVNSGGPLVNFSSNWWGNNTPQSIPNGVMDDYYQVELSANQTSTRDLNNSSVNGFVPVPLGYRMCLNGLNNTGNISNLPDFNATIKLNNNTGLFRSDIGLFRVSPFMSPGDSFDVLAKSSWNDTINNPGNYTFSALVDNQQLNINLAAERMNTSLSIVKTVNSTNVSVGDLVGYTIKVANNGINNISTPILVNDTLSNSLEYVGSSASAGNYSHSSGLWTIPGLNSDDTATLDISVRVKSSGNLINHASFVLDEYNNNQTNDSSVNITVNPSSDNDTNTNDTNGTGGGMDGNDTNTNGGGMDGDTNGFDQTFFKSLTGFPLIFLVLLSVLGVYYWRRK
ncbi:MAG: DUF11 domain-containing protein partial [Methanobrevibacter sp. CfCl-M3]